MPSAIVYTNPVYTDDLLHRHHQNEQQKVCLPYWQSKTLSQVKSDGNSSTGMQQSSVQTESPVRVQMRRAPTREIAKCAQRFGLTNIPLDENIFCLQSNEQPAVIGGKNTDVNHEPTNDKQQLQRGPTPTTKRKMTSPHVKRRDSSSQPKVSTSFPVNDDHQPNSKNAKQQDLQRRFISPTKTHQQQAIALSPQKISPFHCARQAKLRANAAYESKHVPQEEPIGVEKRYQYSNGDSSAPNVLYRSVRMTAANRAMKQRLRLSDIFDDLQRKQDEKHPTAIQVQGKASSNTNNEINRRQSMIDTTNCSSPIPNKRNVTRRRPTSMLIPSTSNSLDSMAPLVQIKEVMDDEDENCENVEMRKETDEEFSRKMANATLRLMDAQQALRQQQRQREVNRAKRRSLISFPSTSSSRHNDVNASSTESTKTATASFLGLLFGKKKPDQKRLSASISSPILIPSGGSSHIRSAPTKTYQVCKNSERKIDKINTSLKDCFLKVQFLE